MTKYGQGGMEILEPKKQKPSFVHTKTKINQPFPHTQNPREPTDGVDPPTGPAKKSLPL